ncbi:MAG: hypothetical protein U0939_05635 [Pirellulales bacterium]
MQVLLSDPERAGVAGLMLDISHAILQNGEQFESKTTDAFQEVVSDLFDGFLSAEDRKDVEPPDLGSIAPLVKWGNPDSGPYTWPVDSTSQVFGVGAGIVNLPPGHGRRGLLGWAALGHETGGHDILHADSGLESELANLVFAAVRAELDLSLARYWSERIDETASDVLGILNMGPAAGIGIVGYFRGLFADHKLRNIGPANDSHPADIVRGFLAAETTRLLDFDDAKHWADAIEGEVDKDIAQIRLNGVAVSVDKAKKSAAIVASAIAQSKLASLEHHALLDIQNWRNEDEQIVNDLTGVLTNSIALPAAVETGFYAAHLVAAGVVASLKQGANLPQVFSRMTEMLKRMHDRNPSWGPLLVNRPGSVTRHFAYRLAQ